MGMVLRAISETRVKIYSKMQNHKKVEGPGGKGEGSRAMQKELFRGSRGSFCRGWGSRWPGLKVHIR